MALLLYPKGLELVSSDKKLNILFLASEVEGLVKTGGLADVAYALPKALVELGHDVRIVMPAYRAIADIWSQWPFRPHHLEVSFFAHVDIRYCYGEHNGLKVVAVDHPASFDRAGLYDDGSYGFDDNAFRYAIMSKAGLAWCELEHWQPDIVHANDWQASLACFYLAEHFKYNEFFSQTRSVLSLHNAAYQGHTDARWLHGIGIHERFFNPSDYEDHGHVNLLKGAIGFADCVNTVSPGYAGELVTEEGGHGLHYKFAQFGRMQGILNGCDYDQWNPETDKWICKTFSTPNDGGKAKNKRALQKEVGLPILEDMPLLGTICRLVEQKGIQLMIPMLWDLMRESPCQVVILGSGDKGLSEQLERLQFHYPDYIRFIQGYDVGLSHRIEAGIDAFLMPSIFEPCGLNQIYSLRYGSLPLVRETGGLKDSVVRLNDTQKNTKTATGFMFKEISEYALLDEVKRLLRVYREKPNLWLKMQENAMNQRFDWEKSAKKYERLYRGLLNKPKREHALL